jgi:hypothetical protein
MEELIRRLFGGLRGLPLQEGQAPQRKLGFSDLALDPVSQQRLGQERYEALQEIFRKIISGEEISPQETQEIRNQLERPFNPGDQRLIGMGDFDPGLAASPIRRPLPPILPEGDLFDRVIDDVPEPDASVDRISGRELARYAPFGEEMTLMAQGIKDDDRNPLLQGPPVGLPATRMRPVSVPDSIEAVDSLSAMNPSMFERRVNRAFDMLADADSIRGARRDRRRSEAAAQRRTEGIPFLSAADEESDAFANLISQSVQGLDREAGPLEAVARPSRRGSTLYYGRSGRGRDAEEAQLAEMRAVMDALPQAREENFRRSVRATQGAIRPPDPPRLRIADTVREALTDPRRTEETTQAPVEVQEPVASPVFDQKPEIFEDILSTLKLTSPTLPEPSFVSTNKIKVPRVTSQQQSSAMRADRARPRRRLQPTAPGIFGELLDESITDFQGAPMMSEREILRMIRESR